LQFTFIVAVSAHVGSVLLIGWMTIQICRHLQRIEQRLAVLESVPERVSVAWPEPAAPASRLKPAAPPRPSEPVPLRKLARTRHMSYIERHDEPAEVPIADPNAVNPEPAPGRA
jgi:hypothetical protein